MARRPTRAQIETMLEEACVDAYDEEEQVTGLFTMLDENLDLPFATEVLGQKVKVVALDLTDSHRIAADCRQGAHRQRIALEDLPLPSPEPDGAIWIAVYRYWLGAR